MKKLILSLSILLTSLSISAQLTQVSEYWDIYRTKLRTQYTVIAATNEKQGIYKEWSLKKNLIVQCNYVKNELSGDFTEYFDTPGLIVRYTVNYKNGQKNGWEKSWDCQNNTTNQTLLCEELVDRGLKPKFYLSKKQEYKNGEKTNNFIEFSANGDTIEYSKQTEIDANTYIVTYKGVEGKSEVKYKRDNINSPYYEVIRKQWKNNSKNGWYMSLHRDKEKGIYNVLEYYDNGNKHFEAVDGAPDFIGHKEITYSESGKPQTIKNFKKGEETCFLLTAYDENGVLLSEAFSNPLHTKAYENGILTKDVFYNSGGRSIIKTVSFYPNGKIKEETNSESTKTYNESGLLICELDKKTNIYSYFENNILIKKGYYNSGDLIKVEEYYPSGKIKTMEDTVGKYTYDENGIKRSEEIYKKETILPFRTENGRYYKFDASQNRYFETLSSTDKEEVVIIIKKTYNVNGAIESEKIVTDTKNNDGTERILSENTYYLDGQLKSELKREAKGQAIIYTVYEYEYKSSGKQKIISKTKIKEIIL